MKHIYAALIALSISLPAYAWDDSVLIGSWESYTYSFGHNYRRIDINDDYSGVFTQVIDDGPVLSSNFNKNQISFNDGYAVLNLDETFTFILSAWGKRVGGSSKRLLGQQFIYQTEDKEKQLINSISLSMSPAGKGGLIEFINNASTEQGKTTNKALNHDAQ